MITAEGVASTAVRPVHTSLPPAPPRPTDPDGVGVTDIELGTAYTWTGARDLGATRRQIAQDGVRMGRGLYLSSAVEPELTTRCRAWRLVLPGDVAFGLGTAARLYGAPIDEPPTVHVVVPSRRQLPRRAGVTVHERLLAEEDVVVTGGLPLTSGPQTFLDLAARLPPAELVAVGDALLRAGEMDAGSLARRLERADRVRGVVRARECAPRLDGRAASRPESLVRHWLVTSDLPDPQVQVPVCDRWGRAVVHADLGYPEWEVALEYDGRQHAGPGQFGRDVDRYSLMAADGWLVLRFAARHLGGPVVVVERTRRALISRGWRP
ncbi:Transcriptional regulator, AbiEi antitoxin, Type IV TA system [Geodermatophilus sp. DSM 45219]|nr:Transcriptional regulator, AbiEi antitoxin, Type IV TA system [Geodermatophilus sp. DSM 45219]